MALKKMRKKSPWLFTFSCGGCNGCDIETVAAITPKYDVERFGCLLKGTPRHADIFLVTGPVTRQAQPRLKELYTQIPHPKVVIAVGTCACSGGIFRGCYGITNGADNSVPVDVYLPGCPPKPEALIDAVVKSLSALEQKKAKEK